MIHSMDGSMRYVALAADYDGTLALDGLVNESVVESLHKFNKTGRKLILVTGRRLEDLLSVFPAADIFDFIVAENGALLYNPATKEEKLLTELSKPELIELLALKNVYPIEIGKGIVATWRPHETAVLESIRQLGLEHQIIFNKGAVMVLPPGINKASGLGAALLELGISHHNVVGIGDAENDLAFLNYCGCSAAVFNALSSVKKSVDYVTAEDHGEGVIRVIRMIMNSAFVPAPEKELQRSILLGADESGGEAYLEPCGKGFLITGTSGSGKSTATLGILERLVEKEYQFCLIDPEGDFEPLDKVASIGNSQHAPTVDEVMHQLKLPATNAIVNLLGVPLADRPLFLANLLPPLQSLRNSSGRPHWIIIDEAHHMLSKADHHVLSTILQDMTSTILITVHPDELEPEILSSLEKVLVFGQEPDEILSVVATAYGAKLNQKADKQLEAGEAIFWQKDREPRRIKVTPSATEKRRHLRKYAEGDVGRDKSFYFTGPDKKLNLRAQNLILFVQIAEGVDDATWLYHLSRGEYSHWLGEAIKDSDLAEQTALIERNRNLSPGESKSAIFDLIKARYTASAVGPQLNSENILR